PTCPARCASSAFAPASATRWSSRCRLMISIAAASTSVIATPTGRLARRPRAGSRPCAGARTEPPMTTPERPASSVDPQLLEILVCTLTKGTLEYDAERQELISRSAKLAYPIRDGIPIMLPEEARKLD